MFRHFLGLVIVIGLVVCHTCPAHTCPDCNPEKCEKYDPDGLIYTAGVVFAVIAVTWLVRASMVRSWPFNPYEIRPACPPGHVSCPNCLGTSWIPAPDNRPDNLKSVHST